MVNSDEFDRHYADAKTSRDTSVDSHDWRPKFCGDIVTLDNGYRHSFSETIVPGANAQKKFKSGVQNSLHSKFNRILRDYSEYFCFFRAESFSGTCHPFLVRVVGFRVILLPCEFFRSLCPRLILNFSFMIFSTLI